MVEKKKIWFPAKTYGVGWGLPVAWQGWAVFLGYLFLMVAGAIQISEAWDLLWFFPMAFFLTAGILLICWKKGEEMNWRWGDKEK